MTSLIVYDPTGALPRLSGLLDGRAARCAVDTGIGRSRICPELAREAGLDTTTAEVVTRSAAGAPTRSPLVRCEKLVLGQTTLTDVELAVRPLDLSDVDLVLGLDLLGPLPLTIDPAAGVIRLGAQADDDATHVPARVERDQGAVTLFVDLTLPDGTFVDAQLASAAPHTILDDGLAGACEVTPTGDLTIVPGPISLALAAHVSLAGASVSFRRLRFDGMLGADFVGRYVQTYDTRRARLSLHSPS